MRILLSSHRFDPDVGGIESASMLLGCTFAEAGHEVVIVTQSGGRDVPGWPFKVVRQPGPRELLCLVRRSEVLFQNHLSLQTAWPLLFIRRPWVVMLQTWLPRHGWTAKLKRWSLRLARRLYISEAIGKDVGLPGWVIGNPYDDQIFQFPVSEQRERELLFVGRLVSDKGVDLLLEALGRLCERGLTPALTVVGAGPEEKNLRRKAAALGLGGQVQFAGPLSGKALAAVMQSHRILVVPSRWAEPFGIVTLEGIACGCRVVVSDQGGLPEAAGSCGSRFPNGDVAALANKIQEELEHRRDPETLRAAAADHLAHFHPRQLAAACLQVFAEKIWRQPR